MELQYCQPCGLSNLRNQRSDLADETAGAENPVPHMTPFFPGLIFQTDDLGARGKRTSDTKNDLVLPSTAFFKVM